MTAHPRWRSDPRCQAAAWQALTAGSRWSLYYLNGHFEDPSRAKPELTRVRLLELAVASDKPEPEAFTTGQAVHAATAPGGCRGQSGR